ncbi:hypothetical protein ACH5RR_001642 [Cinchona calisaya]|uniref:Uncharacterized protein n=1 Tax=Cinchona calisaya TaxID=153742 RepID=A0ABD3B4A0_9GENT
MWTTSGNNLALTSADTSTRRVTRDKKARLATSTIDSVSGSGMQMVVAASRTKSSVNTSPTGKLSIFRLSFSYSCPTSQAATVPLLHLPILQVKIVRFCCRGPQFAGNFSSLYKLIAFAFLFFLDFGDILLP